MTKQFAHQEQNASLSDFDDSEKEIIFEGPSEKEEGSKGKLFFLNFPLFQWKVFFFFLFCGIAVAAHWIFTSELFNVPRDVFQSRKHFFSAKDHYENNKEYWDAKQNHFIRAVRQEMDLGGDDNVWYHLQGISSEILISFLVRELGVNPKLIGQVAIAPQKGSSSFKVILSKYEQVLWPLQIMLSLEMEFKIKSGHFSIEFTRLRRGSQDISLGLSWAYFGPELEPLKKLELFTLPSLGHTSKSGLTQVTQITSRQHPEQIDPIYPS